MIPGLNKEVISDIFFSTLLFGDFHQGLIFNSTKKDNFRNDLLGNQKVNKLFIHI